MLVSINIGEATGKKAVGGTNDTLVFREGEDILKGTQQEASRMHDDG